MTHGRETMCYVMCELPLLLVQQRIFFYSDFSLVPSDSQPFIYDPPLTKCEIYCVVYCSVLFKAKNTMCCNINALSLRDLLLVLMKSLLAHKKYLSSLPLAIREGGRL